jgi:hypothetical protein
MVGVVGSIPAAPTKIPNYTPAKAAAFFEKTGAKIFIIFRWAW